MSKLSKAKQDMKMVYFGTPHFSEYVLEELEQAGISPQLIVTTPDKPAGRGLALKSSPVRLWAEERGIDVITPETLTIEDGAAEILFNSEWDLFVVAAYGKLLPKNILDIPQKGTLNVHPSLLPKFRGPSPIESQILADAKEVGVSVILLDEKTDHGPILAQASITPEPWPFTRVMLEDLLWHEGGKLLAEAIPQWLTGQLKTSPQDDAEATFTLKLSKEDGFIDLSEGGYTNYLKYAAYEGWPGTYFFIEKNGKKIRIKIVEATYENEVFTPTRIVPEGKKEMLYVDFMRNLN